MLDGATAEPVFDASLVVIEFPEGLGYGAAMGSAAEYPGDAL